MLCGRLVCGWEGLRGGALRKGRDGRHGMEEVGGERQRLNDGNLMAL